MELRSCHWPTRSRQVVRKEIYNCSVCRRLKGQAYKADLLSDMPEFRSKEEYPITSTGVHFAGPLSVKSSEVRKLES